MRRHSIAARDFDALASGAGGAETVRSLRAVELSRRLLLFRLVMDRADDLVGAGVHATASPGGDPPRGLVARRALDLLAASSQRSSVEVHDILMHPAVGVWLSGCLRGPVGSMGVSAAPSVGSDPDENLGRLTALALTAAVRVGEPADLVVRAVRGWLCLPTLGDVHVADGTCWLRATVDAGSSLLLLTGPGCVLRVDTAGSPDERWHPPARIQVTEAGVRLEILVDDAHFRDDGSRDAGPDHSRAPTGFGTPKRDQPLDERELAHWCSVFDDGWRLLVRHHRQQAAAMSASLSTVVPLADGLPEDPVSATSADAFGAIAMTRPSNPLDVAATLIHEFQHGKLFALLHLVQLMKVGADSGVGTDPSRAYYAPWRSDPRPLPGLLQGAYAFLGLVEFWHGQWMTGDAVTRRRAGFEFARWREGVSAVLRTLTESGMLTAHGHRFVGGMRERVDTWLRIPVEPDILAEARRAAVLHRDEWRRHGHSEVESAEPSA